MKVARDLDAEARATFSNDKALGLGQLAPAPGESPATTEQVPVLLSPGQLTGVVAEGADVRKREHGLTPFDCRGDT
jgi:hypothetical protein